MQADDEQDRSPLVQRADVLKHLDNAARGIVSLCATQKVGAIGSINLAEALTHLHRAADRLAHIDEQRRFLPFQDCP
jgi:hypothetical protein